MINILQLEIEPYSLTSQSKNHICKSKQAKKSVCISKKLYLENKKQEKISPGKFRKYTGAKKVQDKSSKQAKEEYWSQESAG